MDFSPYQIGMAYQANGQTLSELETMRPETRVFLQEMGIAGLLSYPEAEGQQLQLTTAGKEMVLAQEKVEATDWLNGWAEDMWCSPEDIPNDSSWQEMMLPHLNNFVVEEAKKIVVEEEKRLKKYNDAKEANRVKTFSRLIFGNQDLVQAELNAILVNPQVEYVTHTQSMTDNYVLITLVYKAKSEVK